MTIAITNHENLLDPAVWRRFDTRMQIGMPSVVTRVAIIERYLNGFPLSQGAAKVLAWMTDGFSGSDLETMCDAIKRHLTLESERDPSILDALEMFLDLSASNIRSGPRDAFAKGRSEWMQAALANTDIKITQSDLAEVTGSNQSTVSRLVRSA